MAESADSVVALLTAKGRSGLAGKNILPVLGKPLISYPAEAARRSQHVKHFFCSSESDAVLGIAGDMGYTPIKRPEELARPESRHEEAIRHALEVMATEHGVRPGILVVLLGNNVTTTAGLIDKGIELCLEDSRVSAAVPVYRDQDHHPYRAKRLNAEGCLDTFFDFEDMDVSTNRQELEPCFFLCHNFWVLNTRNSMISGLGQKPWTFMGTRVKPIEVETCCCDVHDADDIPACEAWLRTHDVPLKASNKK